MTEIPITLNGEPRHLPVGGTLDSLIDFFSLPRQRVAVEHNNKVIRRVDWPTTAVAENDKIEIVHFVGGG